MSNTPRDQEHERAHVDREPSGHRGLVVTLWLLALLIAEYEFWILAFAHMYRT